MWSMLETGGGGAPVRDRNGRIITDRRTMHGSWNRAMDSNEPHEIATGHFNRGSGGTGAFHSSSSSGISSFGDNYSANRSSNSNPIGTLHGTRYDFVDNALRDNGMNSTFVVSNGNRGNTKHGTTSSDYGYSLRPGTNHGVGSKRNGLTPNHFETSNWHLPTTDQKQHKHDLAQQIEFNKQLAEKRKQQERDEEAREQRKLEAYAARQRQEMENERRREEDKKAGIERKRQAAIARSEAAATNRSTNNKPSDGLEWWERKADNNSRGLRSGARRDVSSPYDALKPLESSSHGRQRRASSESRQSYRPSSTAKRNEKTMRQMSALRERLQKEQNRVKHAMKTDSYNMEVFSDTEDEDRDHFMSQLKTSNNRGRRYSNDSQ